MSLTLVHSQARETQRASSDSDALTFALDEADLCVLWLSSGGIEHVVAGCVAAGAMPANERSVAIAIHGIDSLVGPGFDWRGHADGSATLVCAHPELARAVLHARIDDLCTTAGAPPLTEDQLGSLLEGDGAQRIRVQGGSARRDCWRDRAQ